MRIYVNKRGFVSAAILISIPETAFALVLYVVAKSLNYFKNFSKLYESEI